MGYSQPISPTVISKICLWFASGRTLNRRLSYSVKNLPHTRDARRIDLARSHDIAGFQKQLPQVAPHRFSTGENRGNPNLFLDRREMRERSWFIGWGGAIRNKNSVFSAFFFITLKILKYETLYSLGNLVKWHQHTIRSILETLGAFKAPIFFILWGCSE